MRRPVLALVVAAFGVGAALGAGACGEERGGVDVEGGTTGGTGTAPTSPTSTTRTATDEPTETAP